MNPPVCKLTQGTIALVVSIPHGGELLPDAFAAQMQDVARVRADTDWHLGRLYAFATTLGASVVAANYSRYVIDVNRPANGESLYPGQNTTALCPRDTFLGEPLYPDPEAPSSAEVADRIRDYWNPYHSTLAAEIARLRQLHGHVLLWEAHSIASVLPRLFAGRLPDLNIGTNSGASCAPALREAVIAAASASPFSWVADERFRGGHITRHYGQPQRGVHAVQLEMAQAIYMDEAAPFGYREDLAARLWPTLRDMVERTLAATATLPPVAADAQA
ncbi:N-formylglutamate deformylase [Cupriavidus basilensis]|uniref:N-formylglutamate deformylase n=1 Tax=Cupriavidus basilensis TaxID=68895 RepID=UPI00157AAADC|nr:N-formylglutamate deformylase [Cupriavidus basilensis]NUA30361.1 N-formylglutamate deformylase [Cupriavidus basilensis]